ncbi:hypothetical protein AMATHDRAFT_50310 [Amanita thiersii Skay4041]|uniref:F-box domain-containing protein n=1 Tax=Amanita thiersii Skay4041 TaxID=703135 RepID=A0A2A9NIF8_9AGAR|nr:hypothetical protein AMATHDRAFT_50310 [Amanita thiersii Skay4041]
MLKKHLHHISQESQSVEQNSSTKQNYKYHKDGDHSTHAFLHLPSETLTGITSYLHPPSLLSLAKVNSSLYNHVKNDNTWRRAFVSRYLGIGPENDLHDVKISLLRRSQKSWRNEYILRYKLERRWENSRNSAISHVPLPSTISSIHLMPYQLALSSSLRYGVIARSLPLQGKILSGYLSPEGMPAGVGLGIGNPNADFVPNATTCAITSQGGFASLLWGFSNGEVAIVLANKVMEARRITTDVMRCRVSERHEGTISDSVWDLDAVTAVTGGIDGCIWTSERHSLRPVPDACTKIATAISYPEGYITAVFRSGDIILWSGFLVSDTRVVSAAEVQEIRISCPLQRLQGDESPVILPEVSTFSINSEPDTISILVAYHEHPYFYRVQVDKHNGSMEVTTFGDPSFGPISSVSPYFATQPGEGSFVMVGDSLGFVSIYDWEIRHVPGHPVQPARKFEAHEDGSAVTSMAWNGVTLITGSARGTVHVWDGLTFGHLRRFDSHHSRRHRHHHHTQHEGANDDAVKQIAIDSEKEVFIASSGNRLLAWRVGPVPADYSGKLRGRNSASHSVRKNRSGHAKYIQQLEMKETIKESQHLVAQESESYKRAFNREKEHRAKLNKLGLTEAEAIEYVMMLSRDEASGKRGDRVDGVEVPNMTEDDITSPMITGGGGMSEGEWGESFEAGPSRHAYAYEEEPSFSSRSSSPTASSISEQATVSGYVSTTSDSQVASSPPESIISPVPTARASIPVTRISSGQQQQQQFPPISFGSSSSQGSESSSISSSVPSTGSRLDKKIQETTDPGPFTSVRDSNNNSAQDGSTGPSSIGGSTTVAPGQVNTSSSSSPSGTKMSWSGVAKLSMPTRSSTGTPRHNITPSSSVGSPSSQPSRPRPSFHPVGSGGGLRYASGSSFHVSDDADIDDDLRFALELSLAEARSRGEA